MKPKLSDIIAAQNGNEEIKAKLIEENMGLVHKCARYYKAFSNQVPGIDYNDLLMEGVQGLIRAIERYKPEKGSFSNYALIWIRCRMLRFIRREQQQMKIYYPAIANDEDDEQLLMDDLKLDETFPPFDYEEFKRKIECANIPQRSKTILKLYFIEGLSLQEVGKIIGLSKERVRQLIKQDGTKILES